MENRLNYASAGDLCKTKELIIRHFLTISQTNFIAKLEPGNGPEPISGRVNDCH